MDKEYVKAILESMTDKKRASVLSALQKEKISIPGGWKTLGKVPNQLLINMLLTANKAIQTSFLLHVCEICFGKMDPKSYQLMVEQPINVTPDNVAGYLAIYALRGEEESQEAINLLTQYDELQDLEEKSTEQVESDPSSKTTDDNNIQTENVHPEHFDKKEANMTTTIGYMRIIPNRNNRCDFFNFYPTHRFDETHQIVQIEDPKNEYPQLGNILLYTAKGNDSLLYDYFNDSSIYIIDIGKDDLEENINVNFEINPTNYKISFERLKKYKKIHSINDYNMYYVVNSKETNPDFNKDIFVDENDPFFKSFVEMDKVDDKVLLKVENKLYGPFNLKKDINGKWIIDLQGNKTNYIVSYYETSEELDDLIIPIKSGYRNTDQYKYIIKIDKAFKETKVDYIPEEKLIEMLSIMANKEYAHSSVSDILADLKTKSDLPFIVEGNEALTQARVERVIEILQNIDDAKKYEVKLNEILKNIFHEAVVNDSEGYEFVAAEEILKKYLPGYKEALAKRDELEKQNKELEEKREALEREGYEKAVQEKEGLQENINTLKQEKEKLENEIQTKKDHSQLIDDVEHLRNEREHYSREKFLLEQEVKKAKEDLPKVIDSIIDTTKISESIAKSITEDYVSTAIIEASAKKTKAEAVERIKAAKEKTVEYMQNVKEPTDIKAELCRRVKLYRPDYSTNEILNILICYTQCFLTVFCGDPGTGKTSICKIIGHVLGLDCIHTKTGIDEIDRFVQVAVERGWTSKRDFIGYHNPLTKTFDSNNNRVYNGLKLLDAEATSDNSKLPFIILLDEANLSAMEYYWADFMNLCDDWSSSSSISLGNNEVLRIPQTLRFVATINNDFTTESLSPRLLDRAWVTLLPEYAIGKAQELIFNEDFEPILWSSLYDAFGIQSNYQLTGRTEKIIKEIYEKLKNLNIHVSPRSDKAIRNYCSVASNIFDDADRRDLIAVDYAVAQKLLTKISGNGEQYRDSLENLRKYFNERELTHSEELVTRVIKSGDSMMGYYRFL